MILESAVFESVVRVVDRLTDLLKYRQSKRKEFFTAVIEPLFDDLMIMHSDYIKMFDECRAQLANSQTPLSEIADALRHRRSVYEPLRIKTRAICSELAKADHLEEGVRQFLQAAAYQIPDGSVALVHFTPSFGALHALQEAADELVDVAHNKNDSAGERKRLLIIVIETANHIRTRFAWICEEYVRLKLRSLR